MNTPFEITREEVLELAAKKLVDAYGGDPDMSERAEEMIKEKVGELFSQTKLKQRIDDCLTAELDRLHLDATLRHQGRLHALRMAKPHNPPATLATNSAPHTRAAAHARTFKPHSCFLG